MSYLGHGTKSTLNVVTNDMSRDSKPGGGAAVLVINIVRPAAPKHATAAATATQIG